MSLDGTGVFDRTAQVVTDRPIAVYQVNPADPAAAANGSSLLLPVEALGKEYRVLAWPTQPLEQGPMNMKSQHGYFVVVAVEPGQTQFAVEVPVATEHFAPLGGKLQPGQSYQVTLQQGEVAQFAANGEIGNGNYDLSGAHVSADKKVAVFSGHEEAVVCGKDADQTCCADHIEELLLPVDRWSTEFQWVKAPGTFVHVDGVQVPGDQFETVAVGAFAAGYVEIGGGGSLVECDSPCALYSYGYHGVAAYGHGAGLGE